MTLRRSRSFPQGIEHVSSFLIFFYQIDISMTNDCVPITKTLMMGVKLMTERYKKIPT